MRRVLLFLLALAAAFVLSQLPVDDVGGGNDDAFPSDPTPKPTPPKKPCPPRRPCPALSAQVAGRVGPDGTELQCDLPATQHLRNKAGRDGAGLCVFTSCEMACDWGNVQALIGFRDWMTKRQGGGWPEKLSAMIEAYCKERNAPVPAYVQWQGYDPELIRKACASGRIVCVTYYRSPTGRYGGEVISHMVCVVHADADWFVVLDNNYPGDSQYEWIRASEFAATHNMANRAWCVVFLAPPPPPPPLN